MEAGEDRESGAAARPAAPVLVVKNLSKAYGDTIAAADISFKVSRGEIVGLLGPNGAGKTTIINSILGILGITEGSISIEGCDLTAQRPRAVSFANFAAVYAPLPGNLTVQQNLSVFALIYGVKNRAQRISELLERFELKDLKNIRCGVLSSGEQTRVCLAKALLNSPRLLLLDEPTASLDPAAARDVRRRMRRFADSEAGAVLWTSHNMYEVAEVCDRVLFLSHGRILLEGDPKTLPQEHGKDNLEELFVTVAREPLSLELG